jgi:hypothetical protein
LPDNGARSVRVERESASALWAFRVNLQAAAIGTAGSPGAPGLFLVRRLFHRLRQLRGDLFRPHEMDAAPEVVAAPRHAISRSALWQAILSPKRRNTWETGELILVVRPNCHCRRRLRKNSCGELFACPAHDPARAFSERTPTRMSKSNQGVLGASGEAKPDICPDTLDLVAIVANVHVWRCHLGGVRGKNFHLS